MKWFKHFSDANRDQKLVEVKSKFGLWGIAAYWYILERIADQMGYEENPTTKTMFEWSELAGYLATKRSHLVCWLDHANKLNLFEVVQTRQIIIIDCPKLLLLRDNTLKDLQAPGKKKTSNLQEPLPDRDGDGEGRRRKSFKESPASPHPLENEDPFDQETLKQNIEDFKTLVKTAIPKIRNNFDDPRSVDLSKIIVQNNGQLLDEPAKHRLWNKLVKLWGIRGWRYSMIQSVFEVCAKEVLTAQIDGDLFPYFEKTLTNYCNQNAEILTANSRK